jgi:hypothetical protein
MGRSMAYSLAQIGISPSGMLVGLILGGLIICLWIALLALSIVGVGVGALLMLFGRRGGRIVLVASTAAAIILGYLGYRQEYPREVPVNIVVDSSLAPPLGKWNRYPWNAQWLAYSGTLHAHVEFFGHVIDESAELVFLECRNGKMFSILVQSQNLPFDQACAMTEKYMNAWGLNHRDFYQWRANKRAGKPVPVNDEDRVFATGSGMTDPSLDVELRQVPGFETWSVNLEVCWLPAATRASLATTTQRSTNRP